MKNYIYALILLFIMAVCVVIAGSQKGGLFFNSDIVKCVVIYGM